MEQPKAPEFDLWVASLTQANPSMEYVAKRGNFPIIRWRGLIWEVLGGTPEDPQLREVR